MNLASCPVIVLGQHCLLGHHLPFLWPCWSCCCFWALMLLLLWPAASHQSLPRTLPSVLKTHKCFHCARPPGVYSKVRTMPQAPFLFLILGLSSRHIEILRENGLSGFGFLGCCLLCLHLTPKSLAESRWASPKANLSDKLASSNDWAKFLNV